MQIKSPAGNRGAFCSGDIFQHRERNDDWGGPEWVYDDPRLKRGYSEARVDDTRGDWSLRPKENWRHVAQDAKRARDTHSRHRRITRAAWLGPRAAPQSTPCIARGRMARGPLGRCSWRVPLRDASRERSGRQFDLISFIHVLEKDGFGMFSQYLASCRIACGKRRKVHTSSFGQLRLVFHCHFQS